ncbi:unnamed protein product [Protopolystoma xenopodis]|uniref:Uncharacterized protein n=1 Tax=Protopolystoma xenopodis TaxID=117903 RepID=A0A448WBI8_9PLAT|nr:unnamed protein product [Protopolystoma xenopodis]
MATTSGPRDMAIRAGQMIIICETSVGSAREQNALHAASSVIDDKLSRPGDPILLEKQLKNEGSPLSLDDFINRERDVAKEGPAQIMELRKIVTHDTRKSAEDLSVTAEQNNVCDKNMFSVECRGTSWGKEGKDTLKPAIHLINSSEIKAEYEKEGGFRNSPVSPLSADATNKTDKRLGFGGPCDLKKAEEAWDLTLETCRRLAARTRGPTLAGKSKVPLHRPQSPSFYAQTQLSATERKRVCGNSPEPQRLVHTTDDLDWLVAANRPESRSTAPLERILAEMPEQELEQEIGSPLGRLRAKPQLKGACATVENGTPRAASLVGSDELLGLPSFDIASPTDFAGGDSTTTNLLSCELAVHEEAAIAEEREEDEILGSDEILLPISGRTRAIESCYSSFSRRKTACLATSNGLLPMITPRSSSSSISDTKAESNLAAAVAEPEADTSEWEGNSDDLGPAGTRPQILNGTYSRITPGTESDKLTSRCRRDDSPDTSSLEQDSALSSSSAAAVGVYSVHADRLMGITPSDQEASRPDFRQEAMSKSNNNSSSLKSASKPATFHGPYPSSGSPEKPGRTTGCIISLISTNNSRLNDNVSMVETRANISPKDSVNDHAPIAFSSAQSLQIQPHSLNSPRVSDNSECSQSNPDTELSCVDEGLMPPGRPTLVELEQGCATIGRQLELTGDRLAWCSAELEAVQAIASGPCSPPSQSSHSSFTMTPLAQVKSRP